MKFITKNLFIIQVSLAIVCLIALIYLDKYLLVMALILLAKHFLSTISYYSA
jgi:hypothetical protein